MISQTLYPRRSSMSVDVKYSTRATATGGRDGEARSEDGRFVARLSTPKELGGAGGEGTNPEQLFAAGYSACFIGDRKSTRLNSSHVKISYAVFCLKKKK